MSVTVQPLLVLPVVRALVVVLVDLPPQMAMAIPKAGQ
jgi:hypothetical protein